MFSRKMLRNVDPPCGAWGGGAWQLRGTCFTPIYNLMLQLCFLYLGRFFGLIFKKN